MNVPRSMQFGEPNPSSQRAKMEDVLTDLPPPSRFFDEDLDNFATPSPPLPSPLLRLNPNPPDLSPSLLIIAISAPSLSVLRRIPRKTLIGTLILPETPLSSKSCNIYSVDRQPSPAIIVAFHHRVSDERSRAVAKALLGEIRGERALILDSIKVENYRGPLTDEAVGFKLETSSEKLGEDRLIRDWGHLPSGSVMVGLGAAVLGECQMRGWKATMCATWPENGRSAASAAKLMDVMRRLGFDVDGNDSGDDDGIRVSSRFPSELYA